MRSQLLLFAGLLASTGVCAVRWSGLTVQRPEAREQMRPELISEHSRAARHGWLESEKSLWRAEAERKRAERHQAEAQSRPAPGSGLIRYWHLLQAGRAERAIEKHQADRRAQADAASRSYDLHTKIPNQEASVNFMQRLRQNGRMPKAPGSAGQQ